MQPSDIDDKSRGLSDNVKELLIQHIVPIGIVNANLGFLLRSHHEIYSKYSSLTKKQISNQLSYWKTTPTAWRSCIDKFLLKTNDTGAAFGSPSIERFGNREVITPVLQSSPYSLSTSPQLQTEFKSPNMNVPDDYDNVTCKSPATIESYIKAELPQGFDYNYVGKFNILFILQSYNSFFY